MPVPVGVVIAVVPIVRLPLTLISVMPMPVLFVDDTLVKVIPRVVGSIDSAGPPVDMTEPVVTLTVPELETSSPVPLLVVIASDVKDVVPVLVAKFTPVPAVEFLFTVVLPKLKPPAAIVQF